MLNSEISSGTYEARTTATHPTAALATPRVPRRASATSRPTSGTTSTQPSTWRCWVTVCAIAGSAGVSVVEFVEKSDPTVERMLSLRRDHFDDYSEAAFAASLRRCARIVEVETISAAGRKLFRYERVP